MHTPTPEQQAIIDAAVHTHDNLLLNALAGAAKTSTLEMICNALPPTEPVLSLAFNKRIADEMSQRLPGHVKCQTLNSLGHRSWAQALGSKRITLESRKNGTILKQIIDGASPAEKGELFDAFGDIVKLVAWMKSIGYIPAGKFSGATSLISREVLLAGLEDEDAQWIPIAERVLFESIKMAYNGLIDFDDQIYMSTLFGGNFPKYPLVMIDEAQDLSPLNHAMLRKLVTRRIIAVGDPWQSIYGFRGAVSNGMSLLKATFNMTEMTLSISFRCPISVVRHAHKRVPHMKWPEWAIPGEVVTLPKWNASDIPDEAAIICRNNAPLFKLALQLIRNGRGVHLVGADIGPKLVKLLKKLGPVGMVQTEVCRQINIWEETQLAKAKEPGSIVDRAECLRVFAEAGPTLQAAIDYAEHLFAAKGPVQLMSGHKSKGLEFATVYHLDSWRVPSKFAKAPEEIEQELNLEYVITTRAKRSLFFIDSNNFQGDE